MSVLVNGHESDGMRGKVTLDELYFRELFCLCGNKKEMDSQFMRCSIKLTIHFFD